MFMLILAIQSALQGLMGQAALDGSGCPMPNSTRFDVSGWNVNITVDEGDNEGATCPVILTMNLEGACVQNDQVVNFTQALPNRTGDSDMELLVDEQLMANVTGTEEDIGNALFEAVPDGRFCGDSISLRIAFRMKPWSTEDGSSEEGSEESMEGFRRQATPHIDGDELLPPRFIPPPHRITLPPGIHFTKAPTPKLTPAPTHRPTFRRITLPPVIRWTPPPTIRWSLPPTIRWPYPFPWPQYPSWPPPPPPPFRQPVWAFQNQG